MVSMSISSSFRPMSGANFSPVVALKLHATSGSLNISRSNSVLAGLAFWPSLVEPQRSSSPGHGPFLCLLQDSSLSYGC